MKNFGANSVLLTILVIAIFEHFDNILWTRAQEEGFLPEDLYKLVSQNNRTYEALDILKDEMMPEPEKGYNPDLHYRKKPWFFKIGDEQLQVTPSKI